MVHTPCRGSPDNGYRYPAGYAVFSTSSQLPMLYAWGLTKKECAILRFGGPKEAAENLM
jgi:hypothetical protein